MLCPRHFVKAESHACVVQSLANQVATGGWDVVVFLAKDLSKVGC